MIDLVAQRRAELHALCRKYEVRRLELFGSAARDQFDLERSDLDFLVEFIPPGFRGASNRYFGLLEELERLFDRKIDLVSIKAIENPYFLQSVNRNRVLHYAA
jgi:predicted nucleotidyltransferase